MSAERMRARWRAFRSLRLNYTRRGVYRWLRGRYKPTGERGIVRIWREPERIEQEQTAIADGVFL